MTYNAERSTVFFIQPTDKHAPRISWFCWFCEQRTHSHWRNGFLLITIADPPKVVTFEFTDATNPSSAVTGKCEGDSRPLNSTEIWRGNAKMDTTMKGNAAEYIIDSVDCLYSGIYRCVVINKEYAAEPATEDVMFVAHCEW